MIINTLVFLLPTTVPVDVFSPNSEWRGFYEYLGKRQATTFTVTGFNVTSGRVNITLLETSGVSIRLSGNENNNKENDIDVSQSNSSKHLVRIKKKVFLCFQSLKKGNQKSNRLMENTYNSTIGIQCYCVTTREV